MNNKTPIIPNQKKLINKYCQFKYNARVTKKFDELVYTIANTIFFNKFLKLSNTTYPTWCNDKSLKKYFLFFFNSANQQSK